MGTAAHCSPGWRSLHSLGVAIPSSANAEQRVTNDGVDSPGCSRVEITFSICSYGRPTSLHSPRSTPSLCRTVAPPSGMSNTLHASGYRATSGRVRFSPVPPIRMGG
ncbi:hypothetical protein [Dactylosporangium sp. CA-233914]|uniref:hypothetical protein n=1 Tax=Dactylosporangium sp. CA-233914 TaxID=3239934 RepID=UPI003D8ECA13